MYSQFLRDVLVSRPALCHAILAFNGLGRPFVPTAAPGDAARQQGLKQEDSRLWSQELGQQLGLPPSLVASLSATPALRAVLQRASARLTPAAQGFWDFAQESRRLALLPSAVLERLGLVFGVAAHAQRLSRIVVRSQHLVLRRELGEELLDYALQRGRFQIQQAPDDNGEQTHAELPVALSARIWEYGIWALHRLRADWPEELRAASPLPAPSASPADAWSYPGLWNDMKKILLKEVAPAWKPCFD